MTTDVRGRVMTNEAGDLFYPDDDADAQYFEDEHGAWYLEEE